MKSGKIYHDSVDIKKMGQTNHVNSFDTAPSFLFRTKNCFAEMGSVLSKSGIFRAPLLKTTGLTGF